jgi:hypothetical protein
LPFSGGCLQSLKVCLHKEDLKIVAALACCNLFRWPFAFDSGIVWHLVAMLFILSTFKIIQQAPHWLPGLLTVLHIHDWLEDH